MDETTLPTPQIDPDIENFELGDDIEDIPTLADDAHRKITVEWGGKQYEVWHTNNLWATFAQWWRATHPEEYTLHDFDLKMKETRLAAMHFDEIMEQLKQRYPKLFEVLVDLTDEKEQQSEKIRQLRAEGKLPSGEYTKEQIQSGNLGHTPEQEAALREIRMPDGFASEQGFYFSKAFEAMVPIAREIDPNYDTYQFTA